MALNLSNSTKAVLAATALLLSCPAAHADDVTDLIAAGDVFDLTFQASKALENYLPADKLDPKNVPLLVRIARQYRHLMTDAETTKMKLKIGNLSLVYAKRAAALAPTDSEAQLSPAISYGKMLPLLSNREQFDASPRIREAAQKAIKLDPLNDTAWHVLGRWHQALANVSAVRRALGQLFYGKLPVTTNEEAIKCFDKAITINPNRLRHYVELGRTYAQMGKNATARRFIEKGLAMPDLEKDDPDIKRLGRETLAKLP